MTTGNRADGPVDEFDFIARLMKPLTKGAPEALGLLDDAALIPPRPGFDLIVTTDMIVEGVHFLTTDPLDLVARKLLRVNLSDLAAKAAEPYGWFLSVSWPKRCGWAEREAFARGLAEDQDAFGLRLFGGDTTSTSGPLCASATLLGWAPGGQAVRRAGARPGDMVLVSGVVGDGWLGLKAALGELEAPIALQRYRLPEPRLALRGALAAAHACADVSDGLLADVGRIAIASGLAAEIDLERLPLSADGLRHVEGARDRPGALIELATGGDDYELACTAAPERAERLIADAAAAGVRMTVVGRMVEGQGVRAFHEERDITPPRLGYRHG
ncbi:MAG: thiamine-phosphate kinase [Caulobacteraceae bacterium]